MSDEILGSLAKFTSRADMTDAVNILSIVGLNLSFC